jgi:hypothetical protein
LVITKEFGKRTTILDNIFSRIIIKSKQLCRKQEKYKNDPNEYPHLIKGFVSKIN